MALVRKFQRFTVDLEAGTGAVTVRSLAQVTDDVVEEINGPWEKVWNAPAVKGACEAARDAIMNQAAGQGKELTF
jgi:hypothetical protein